MNKGMENLSRKSILFVCLGNICRSPAAEGIMRSIISNMGAEPWLSVDSAGTGRYHIGELPDHRMRIHARRRGLELTHRCRQVTESDFYDFDLIIGMDASNISNLRRICPDPMLQTKIHAMAEWLDAGCRFDHIPDPYYEGAEGFELVLDLLSGGCERLYASLAGQIN